MYIFLECERQNELTNINENSQDNLEENVNITAVYFRQVIVSMQNIEKVLKSIDFYFINYDFSLAS